MSVGSAARTAAAIALSPWLRASRVVYVSTTMAAKMLGYHEDGERIRQLCVAGKISVTIDGVEYGPRRVGPRGKWQVPRAWVEANMAKPPIRR